MTKAKDASQIDLNLLSVFRAMDQERHVTRAAIQLGISQPALSHALKRLRLALGDELFVKTPKGMIPTPKAEKLSPAITEILDKVSNVILGTGPWTLESACRTFRVQSTDLIEHLLVPELVRSIRGTAPQTSVAFTSARFSLPKEELESGKTDLAIAGFFENLPAGFYRQAVFSDSLKVAFRSNHPRLRKKLRLTVEDLGREDHLMIAPGGELVGQLDSELAKLGRARRISVGFSSFVGAVHTLVDTDSLLVGPARMFASLQSSLRLCVLPIPVPTRPLQIVQVWHERNHRDPHHKWLREQVKRILAD